MKSMITLEMEEARVWILWEPFSPFLLLRSQPSNLKKIDGPDLICYKTIILKNIKSEPSIFHLRVEMGF